MDGRVGRLWSWLGVAAVLLGSALATGCANSKPWATCGQECGSDCWPGPRLGCPEACLLAPCPPEPWCPEKKKPKCMPRPRVCVAATPAPGPTFETMPPATPAPSEQPAVPAAVSLPPAPAFELPALPVEGAAPGGDLPPPPAGAVPPIPAASRP